jgi:hypothetical protein
LEGFKFRWFIPGWIIVIFLFKELIEPKVAILSFFVGMLNGFILDTVAHRLKLWSYPRQPFLSKNYFLLVIPAWGVFGSQVNVMWNLVREHWMNIEWLSGVTITTIFLTFSLFVLYEIPNLYRKSWQYSTSLTKVLPGWVLLILFFRAFYKILYLIVSFAL